MRLDTGCALASLIIGVTSVAGWLTHVIVCITEERWGFLIAGAIAAPVGVVHGIGRWFGFW